MTPALPLLVLALGVTPPGKPPKPPSAPAAPVVKQEGAAPEASPAILATADDLARLCGALEPAERLRAKGDAVERGEAETRHDADRDTAIRGRYEIRAPGTMAFAPYDGPERRLALSEPAQIPVADGTARLWPVEERGLAVEADAATARRIIDAQRKGTLALALVFDLPDDATCGTGARGKKFTLPVDPVSWRWLEGDAVLAAGGAAAERPVLTAAGGAKPRVSVGDPLAGPAELRKSVLTRRADLERCYADALKRNPGVDGVLVADMGGARPVIAADSVGDAELATCVARALGPLAPVQGGKAAVPIRFELAPPGAPEPKEE